MNKTASGFVEFARSKIGDYYGMGCFGQMSSKKLLTEKRNQYPNYYNWPESDFNKWTSDPKQVFDCAGLVKSYIWTDENGNIKYNSSQDYGATGIYGKCTEKGPLTGIDLKPGYLLFKGNDKTKSHVGVYIGNNSIIEAKGHNYGVIESKLNDSWKYYALYYLVDYNDVEPTPEPTPAKLEFDKNICNYCKGIDLFVRTNRDDLMLRSTPEIKNNNIIASMPKGSKVTWYGYYSGNWYRVNYNGLYGFAYKSYLGR